MSEYREGDLILDMQETHKNHDEDGFKCPQCQADTELDDSLNEGHRVAIKCDFCGHLFAGISYKAFVNVSGEIKE